MKTLLLLIDFQQVFENDGYWPVENYKETLNTALQVIKKLEKTNKLTIITTKFIPPNSIKGHGWVDYYKNIPKEMHDSNYSGYKLSLKVPKDLIISSNTFGKW